MFKWLNHKTGSRGAKEQDKKVRYDMAKVPVEALASLILELEYQCEGEGGASWMVQQVTAIYLEVMGRFRDQGDPKYQIYKRRMEMFLEKGSTGQLLGEGKAGEARRRETGLRNVKEAKAKSRGEALRMIGESNEVVAKHRSMVEQQLQAQQQSLQRRIKRRHTLSLRWSVNCVPQNDETEESDSPRLSWRASTGMLDPKGEEEWESVLL